MTLVCHKNEHNIGYGSELRTHSNDLDDANHHLVNETYGITPGMVLRQ